MQFHIHTNIIKKINLRYRCLNLKTTSSSRTITTVFRPLSREKDEKWVNRIWEKTSVSDKWSIIHNTHMLYSKLRMVDCTISDDIVKIRDAFVSNFPIHWGSRRKKPLPTSHLCHHDPQRESVGDSGSPEVILFLGRSAGTSRGRNKDKIVSIFFSYPCIL